MIFARCHFSVIERDYGRELQIYLQGGLKVE